MYDIWNHWTAVLTLLGLISSVYHDLPHWRSNQWLQLERSWYTLLMKPYHHHVAPSAQISLTLFPHPSLSSIASGRSSRSYHIAGHPACPYEMVHQSMSLMSLSLLLQQCPTCLGHLTLIIFGMGGKWLYSCCFVGCYLQDLFNIAHSILV